MKSVISRVVIGYMTLRPVKTRPKGPRARVGFLGWEVRATPHQLKGLGERAVSSPSGVRGAAPENFHFGTFGTSEITSERSASF